MMRARNIKPDFFRDAELSEVSIEARYLFIGFGVWLTVKVS
jgi:hypothetical protein